MPHHIHLDPDLPTFIAVEGVRDISRSMRRVRFAGAGVRTYLSKPRIPNIKLFFPEDSGELSLPTLMSTVQSGPEAIAQVFPLIKPRVRTYTVRNYDVEAGWLEVDFVRHGAEGLASSWVESAQPGDVLGVPGGGGRLPAPSKWIGLLADDTGLPAALQILSDLPPEQRGVAVFEVDGEQDHLPVEAPAGVEVQWLHRDGISPGSSRLLLDAALDLDIPEPYEDTFIWAGAESRVIREIRKRARGLGVPRRNLLIIGYWHSGRNETAYADSSDHDRVFDESKVMLGNDGALAEDTLRSLFAGKQAPLV